MHRVLMVLSLFSLGGDLLCTPGVLAAETARTERTLRLAADTPIVVEATIGEVRIQAWDRADVSVVVERRAASAADLQRLRVQIDVAAGVAQVLALHTDDRRDPALSASVVVNAPATAVFRAVRVFEGRVTITGLRREVSATIQRGSIDASNIAGAVRLETGIGNITVTDAELTDPGVLRLRTFNGHVKLQLARRPQSARILALTLNGRIHSDIPLTMKDRVGPHFGETTIGRGEPVVSIDAVTGDVEIRVRESK